MKKKSILFQAKAKLAKMLKLEFESVTTDDGKSLYVDGDIETGAAVYELNDAGEYIPAADGTYTAGDRTVVVSNGMIASVDIIEDYENAEDITEAGEATGDTVSAEEHNELVEIVNEILDVVKEQEEEISNLQEEVIKLDTELKKAQGTTSGKPAGKDVFNRSGKVTPNIDARMKKLIENFK